MKSGDGTGRALRWAWTTISRSIVRLSWWRLSDFSQWMAVSCNRLGMSGRRGTGPCVLLTSLPELDAGMWGHASSTSTSGEDAWSVAKSWLEH